MSTAVRAARYTPLLIALLALPGCGGGGPGGRTNAPLRMTILWANRTRAVNAPASALSAVVSVSYDRSKEAGTGLSWTINRHTDPASYSQDWVSPVPVPTGPCTLHVDFHGDADGSGSTVGQANRSFTLNPDGSGAGTIDTQGTVAHVTVTPGQSLQVGDTVDLTYTVTDASSNTLAISPGSVVWEVTAGQSYLQFTQGHASALAQGTATVTAAVDGVTSSPTDVAVTTPGPVLRYGLAWRTLGGVSKILFAEGAADHMSIYSVNPDGTGKALYCSIGMTVNSFDMSADGSRIVFDSPTGSPDGTVSKIYHRDIGASTSVPLTDGSVTCFSPTISPDGSTIVYGSFNGLYGIQMKMNYDGSGVVGFPDLGPPYHFTYGRYSADGTLLIRTEGYNADEHLFTCAPDGSNKVVVTGPNGFGQCDVLPSLSPDKTKVVYATTYWTGQQGRLNGWFDIAVTTVGQGDRSRMTSGSDSQYRNYWPAFSPDGSKIAFVSDRTGTWQVFTMNAADGSNVTQITH